MSTREAALTAAASVYAGTGEAVEAKRVCGLANYFLLWLEDADGDSKPRRSSGGGGGRSKSDDDTDPLVWDVWKLAGEVFGEDKDTRKAKLGKILQAKYGVDSSFKLNHEQLVEVKAGLESMLDADVPF